MRRAVLTALFIFMFAWCVLPDALGSIINTKHNLSTSGPGTIKAVSEQEICIFCHTPHSAAPRVPLWNHDLSASVYTAYWTPTLDAYTSPALAPPPDNASKLCLSCHDGTIALGALGTKTTDVAFVGGITTMPSSAVGYVGTDLSGSHPISFIVTNALITSNNLKDTPLNPLASMQSDSDGVSLDSENKVQCTTCHNPHDDSNRAASGMPFWRKPTFSGVCTVCHNI